MNRFVVLLAAAVGIGGTISGAAAQDGPAALLVTVGSDSSARPLPGAEVRIAGRPFRWVTDGNGVARIKGLPADSQTVQIRAAGHAPEEVAVQLRPDQMAVVAVVLRPETVVLDPLRVDAAVSHGHRYLERSGFFHRRDAGWGAFRTRDQLQEEGTTGRKLSTALRSVPGVAVIPGPFSDNRVAMSRSRTSSCRIQYFLDGLPVHGFRLDDMPLTDVEGIEIYRGAAEIPARFNSREAGCGVIVIWTRPGGD